MKRFSAILIAFLATGLLVSQQAVAQRFPERWKGPEDRQRTESPRKHRSLDRAVERIRSETDSRVLSTDTQDLNGREVHVIRILTEDGRIRRLRIDAESGRRIQRR